MHVEKGRRIVSVDVSKLGLPDDLRPVSINDHLIEPPTLWDALPENMRARGPKLVETADGGQAWRYGARSFPFRFQGIAAGSDVVRRNATYDEVPAAGSDPLARLEAMDLDGVDVQALAPMYIGFAGE